jgi:hypothetical protein
MARLVRTPVGYVRSLQMSRVKLNVFVEGDVDSFFYGQICQLELGGPFNYTLKDSRQLPTPGQGKSHLLKHFESMRRHGLLVIDFKGQKSSSIFFVDKDVDDRRRTKKRSIHLVYTEYYDVENYIYRYGKLVRAVAAACFKDTAVVAAAIPVPDEWSARAASLWKGWLKLCLYSSLYATSSGCNYRASSQVNAGPAGPIDAVLYGRRLAEVEGVSGLSSLAFQARFTRLSRAVDRCYVAGRQDEIFRGKWYPILLSDELKALGIATGAATNALPSRLTEGLLLSLDFSQPWADYLRQAVKVVAALAD